jgi:hypothetical protein
VERIAKRAVIDDDIEFLFSETFEKLQYQTSDLFSIEVVLNDQQIDIPTPRSIIGTAAKEVESGVRGERFGTLL